MSTSKKSLFDKAFDYANSLGHRYCLSEHLLYACVNSAEFKRFVAMNSPSVDFQKALSQIVSDIIAYFKIYEEMICQTAEFSSCELSETVKHISQQFQTKKPEASAVFLALYNRELTFSSWVISNSEFDKLFVSQSETKVETTTETLTFDSIKSLVEIITPDSSITNRESEVSQLVTFLSKQNKTNVLLIGDAGVGKSAILEYLVYLIDTKSNTIPEHLHGCKIISINVGNLVAGSKLRGEFEAKVKLIFEFVKLNPEYIVFIDEAHMLKGAGTSTSNQNNDFANMIKPVISRSGIKLIAATSWDEYYQSIDRDPALKRRFHVVQVSEPDIKQTTEIAIKIAKRFSEFHEIEYSTGLIEYVVKLNAQYITDRKNPDKTLDFLDLMGASAKLTGITNPSKEFCTRLFCEFNGLDSSIVQPEQSLDLENVATSINQNVIGQTNAIEQLIDLVGLKLSNIDPIMTNKPLTVLFTGSSGVGKTETCIQLAKAIKVPVVKFDMSEFSEPHTVSSLIGTSPGYVGYNQGNGKLIDQISKHTQAVFILDEIEKTHPDILNVFLSLFDTGVISSLNGKQVSAKNHIFIMTSNLGASEAIRESKQSNFGFVTKQQESSESISKKEVSKWFKPELLNRVEKVIYFNTLSDDTYQLIIESQIKQFVTQVFPKCKIEYSSDIVGFIKQKLSKDDASLGARPVTRIINEHLKIPVSKFILRGVNHISVEVKDGKLEWMEYGEV